jgi:hypothetical protein
MRSRQKCVQAKSKNVENLNAPSARTSLRDILAGTRAILFIEYSIMLCEKCRLQWCIAL